MQLSEIEILVKLKQIQDTELFTHSKATSQMAVQLAENLNKNNSTLQIEVEKISIAALLHDLAKGFKSLKLLELVKKYNIHVDKFEEKNPELLHGPVAAAIIQHELGIKDKVIIKAIRNHTTGDKNMSVFEEILFVADHIEINRDYRMVDEIREIAMADFNRALLMVMENKIYYVMQKRVSIHPKTISAWNDVIRRLNCRDGKKIL